MKAAMLTIAAGMLVAAGSTSAQTVYKCADSSGQIAYQQTPCTTEAQTQSVRTYKRDPVSSATYAMQPSQAPRYAQEPVRPTQRQQVQPAPYQPRRFDLNPMSDDAEAMRRMEIMARTREGRALLRQMSGQQLPRVAIPDPNQGIGQPVNVIDPRTSMPIQGAIKVAPNRIWDPNTGEYHWTTP